MADAGQQKMPGKVVAARACKASPLSFVGVTALLLSEGYVGLGTGRVSVWWAFLSNFPRVPCRDHIVDLRRRCSMRRGSGPVRGAGG
jgi:hypothetical protein